MRMSIALPLVLLTTVLPASAAEPFKGKIVKLDAAIGKVTLTHGAIAKLDMPAGMTMGYRVADPAMLKGLAVGDRVTFDARDDGGTYTITGIAKGDCDRRRGGSATPACQRRPGSPSAAS